MSLGQFDDGGEAEIVASLRQIERHGGLALELRGDIDALEGGDGAGPGYPNVSGDALLLVAEVLVGFQCPLVRGFASRRKTSGR